MAKIIETRPQTGAGQPDTAPSDRGMGRGGRWRRWLRLTYLGLTSVLCLAVAGGAAYGFSLYRLADEKVKRVGPGEQLIEDIRGREGAGLTEEEIAERIVGGLCEHGACNYLVLGNDSREGLPPGQDWAFGTEEEVSGQRSDTIMLIRVDPRREKTVVLSFPRDLWVEMPDGSQGKITSAYSEGKEYSVAEVVRRLTGLKAKHFLSINLAGFQSVVDSLGGVPICIDRPLYDEDAHLDLPQAGCYTLDGFQALAFVRARHVCGDAIGDFARISRQQQFLRAVLAQALRPGMLLKAPSIIDKVMGNLRVDDELGLGDLIFLTNQLRGTESGMVDFRAVPATPDVIPESDGDFISVVQLDSQAETLFQRLRDGEPLGSLGKQLPLTPPSEANVSVRVFDQSSGGKAEQVSRYLTQAGFNVAPVAPAEGKFDVKRPTIVFRATAAASEQAKVVQGYLPKLKPEIASKGSLAEVSVGVVVTGDYFGEGIEGFEPPPPAEPAC